MARTVCFENMEMISWKGAVGAMLMIYGEPDEFLREMENLGLQHECEFKVTVMEKNKPTVVRITPEYKNAGVRIAKTYHDARQITMMCSLNLNTKIIIAKLLKNMVKQGCSEYDLIAVAAFAILCDKLGIEAAEALDCTSDEIVKASVCVYERAVVPGRMIAQGFGYEENETVTRAVLFDDMDYLGEFCGCAVKQLPCQYRI